MNQKKLIEKRHRLRLRIKSKIFGTSQRPRLNVKKTNRFIYAQIVDDTKGHTLVFKTTCSRETKGKTLKNIESAKNLGREIAELALAKGIKTVVFDRGVYRYHGVIKALADAAREKGLQF